MIEFLYLLIVVFVGAAVFCSLMFLFFLNIGLLPSPPTGHWARIFVVRGEGRPRIEDGDKESERSPDGSEQHLGQVLLQPEETADRIRGHLGHRGTLGRVPEVREKAEERASTPSQQLEPGTREGLRQPKLLDLNVEVAKAATTLRRFFGEDIPLDVIPGSGFARVKGDPVQIEQLLMNLIANSLAFALRGGRVTVKTGTVNVDEGFVKRHSGAKPGPHVVLDVSSTGIGIDEETRFRVFEPLSSARGSQGIGLGLSIAYNIVKQYEGDLVIEGELGQRFKVYLAQAE